MALVADLMSRGLFQQVSDPSADVRLAEMAGRRSIAAYAGFDPTADSLHVGNFVAILGLMYAQKNGIRPIAVVGGATGMIGDPSGKSSERQLLTKELAAHNAVGIRNVLERFLDFNHPTAPAKLVNNLDWFGSMSAIDFLRDIGKNFRIGSMLAKDSVRSRMESSEEGMSYTEFSYQLLQGYDFLKLYKEHDCVLEIGGSDQWGNITAGVELIRRKAGASAFAATVPLLTKSDGSKFGKSESGNVWLDPALSSPYKYYQFWLNVADADAERFIKIFTLFTKEQINALIAEHQKAPHLRALQKTLAKDITIRTHSETDYTKAVEASEILFGSATAAALLRLSEKELLEIFEGVPRTDISRSACEAGVDIVALTVDAAHIFASRGEARRLIAGGGVFVNKEKVADEQRRLTVNDLLCGKYLLIQKGKKNYHLVVAAG